MSKSPRSHFSKTHTGEMLRGAIEYASDTLSISDRQSRTVLDLTDEAVAMIWKYGLAAKLGDVYRDIPASEFCPKLRFLSNLEFEASPYDFSLYVGGLRYLSSRPMQRSKYKMLKQKRKTKIHVGWNFISAVNKICKENGYTIN